MAYMNLYKGNPTGGGTDGSLVGDGNPVITPYLDLSANEEAAVKLAVRCAAGYRSLKETTISSTAAATTLSVEAALGATTISVAAATGLQVHNQIDIGTGGTKETKRITIINGTTITLNSALTNTQAYGAAVVCLSKYQVCFAKDSSGTPGTFGDYGVDLVLDWIGTPENLQLTTQSTGGSLEPGDYSYRTSAIDANGETISCNASTIAVPSGTSTNQVTLTWDAVTGATAYKVYGRTASTELLIDTVSSGTTYVDTGSVTPSGAIPTTSPVQINDTNTVFWAKFRAQSAEAVPYNDLSGKLAVDYKVGAV